MLWYAVVTYVYAVALLIVAATADEQSNEELMQLYKKIQSELAVNNGDGADGGKGGRTQGNLDIDGANAKSGRTGWVGALEGRSGIGGARESSGRDTGVDTSGEKRGSASAEKSTSAAAELVRPLVRQMTQLVARLLNGCLQLTDDQTSESRTLSEKDAGQETKDENEESVVESMLSTTVELQYNIIAYDLISKYMDAPKEESESVQEKSPIRAKLGVAAIHHKQPDNTRNVLHRILNEPAEH